MDSEQRTKSEQRIRARRPSQSEPFFASMCADFAMMFDARKGATQHDRALAASARMLEARFRSFAVAPPSEEQKREALLEFAALQRNAIEGRRR
jgi:hypothetical protein